MLEKLMRAPLALLACAPLAVGAAATSSLPSSCDLTANGNTGRSAQTTITDVGTLVLLHANVVYVGPGGLSYGSGGQVSTLQSTDTLRFQAAGGDHFFWPLSGATWGFLTATSCVEDITIRYDPI